MGFVARTRAPRVFFFVEFFAILHAVRSVIIFGNNILLGSGRGRERETERKRDGEEIKRNAISTTGRF